MNNISGSPFMITQAQKEVLLARGFIDEEIAHLKPEQVHTILNGGGGESLQPDRADAERFLAALDSSPDARFTFQTFDDNKVRKTARAEANKQRKAEGKPKLKDRFARIRHGTLAGHFEELVKLNARGAGIYVTVNVTDCQGREEKNVTRIRAGFADLDGAPLDPVNAAEMRPLIVVESSPSRFHAYWIIGDTMPLDQFEPLQKAIAARFDGDPSIHDLPRVMRLPGFIHRKAEPFLSRLLQINDIESYKWEALQEAFPLPAVGEEEPQPPVEDDFSQPQDGDLHDQWKKLNDEAIRRYSDWVPDIFSTATPSKGGYRVSSADLGRDLEEDLSFHAAGIKDFGVHDIGDSRGGSRTPIDIVEQYLKKDFAEAVRWLAEKLGLDPNDYLPKPRVKKAKKAKKDEPQGSGNPAADAEVRRLAALSPVEYDHQRVGAAKKLGLRTGTLDKLVINERAKQAAPAQAEQEQEEKEEAERRFATNKRLLAQMNAKNSVVLDGARTMVLRFETDEREAGGEHYLHRIPTFLRFYDFRNLYLNHIVDTGGKKSPSLGHWWLTHPQRRQYRGVVFQPGGAATINGRLNLWTGWGVEPKEGEWNLLRKHIREVLAAGDEKVYQYIINWMAWSVQHPSQQAGVALVFIGERGTGKGTLGKALCRIFGQHALHVSNPEHLVGRFNAHLRQCCFLFADEAYGPKDKTAEGVLKRFITEDTLTIEQKGRDPIEPPNTLHVMMASNNDWVVPAGEYERRFVVQKVSDVHRQEKEWFEPLYKQMREGGYAAMLHDLLQRDLDDWHPRQIISTAALVEQQAESLSPLDAWWHELLQTGIVAGADPEQGPSETIEAISTEYEEQIEEGTAGYGTKRTRTVKRKGLLDQARAMSPKLKGVTDAALGRYLGQRGCIRSTIRRPNHQPPLRKRGWWLPPLAECREHWLERFPEMQWDDPTLANWSADEG
jgi:uncharacterized protein DUF5906/DNA primase RepB-like protein